MGFSILTLFEFVFFLYDYVGFTVNLRKRNLIEAARVKAVQVMNAFDNNSSSDEKENKDENKDIPVLKIEETENKRENNPPKLTSAEQYSNNNSHHCVNEIFSIT